MEGLDLGGRGLGGFAWVRREDQQAVQASIGATASRGRAGSREREESQLRPGLRDFAWKLSIFGAGGLTTDGRGGQAAAEGRSHGGAAHDSHGRSLQKHGGVGQLRKLGRGGDGDSFVLEMA